MYRLKHTVIYKTKTLLQVEYMSWLTDYMFQTYALYDISSHKISICFVGDVLVNIFPNVQYENHDGKHKTLSMLDFVWIIGNFITKI